MVAQVFVVLFVFVKIPVDEVAKRIDCLLLVGAVNVERNVAATTGCQHHDTHNTFAVDFLPIFFDVNVGFKA